MAKKKVMTKSALFTTLAEKTELKKADVTKVMDALADLAKAELGPKGPGVFTLPGMARFKIRKVKAVKGGEKKTKAKKAKKEPKAAEAAAG